MPTGLIDSGAMAEYDEIPSDLNEYKAQLVTEGEALENELLTIRSAIEGFKDNEHQVMDYLAEIRKALGSLSPE